MERTEGLDGTEEVEEVDWMSLDAQTILDVIGADESWPVADWPHEQDAKEKLIGILKVLAGRRRPTAEEWPSATRTVGSTRKLVDILQLGRPLISYFRKK